MSGNIVYCTGGNRSGKSAFALGLADGIPGRKLFVATAEARDTEMRARIKKHQKERGPDWHCLEMPVSKAFNLPELLKLAMLPVGGAEASAPFNAILLDCLSTWVSAAQEAWNGAPTELENGMRQCLEELASFLDSLDIPVFVVSSEVGMGVLPASAETRQYCDMLGLANQRMAALSRQAYFCVSGMNIKLK